MADKRYEIEIGVSADTTGAQDAQAELDQVSGAAKPAGASIEAADRENFDTVQAVEMANRKCTSLAIGKCTRADRAC
jgi:hypothetical protein